MKLATIDLPSIACGSGLWNRNIRYAFRLIQTHQTQHKFDSGVRLYTTIELYLYSVVMDVYNCEIYEQLPTPRSDINSTRTTTKR